MLYLKSNIVKSLFMKTNSSCSCRTVPSPQRMVWYFCIIVDSLAGRSVYTSKFYRSFEKCRQRVSVFVLRLLNEDKPVTGYTIEYSYVTDEVYYDTKSMWQNEFED